MANSSSIKPKQEHPLRLRVFAGPNGSGKSTIIHAVKNVTVHDKPIDFGYYINADDIARELRNGPFSFDPFQFQIESNTFIAFAKNSGLLTEKLSLKTFEESFSVNNNGIISLNSNKVEQLAQLIARFLREQLLVQKRRFSFETVFSHPSNLDIMERAVAMGYKVYLYFVSTESAAINKYRVKLRVEKGGHDVPQDKIESRYLRSLDLLFGASQLAYQAYFFDNSIDGRKFKLFAHFKQTEGSKEWDDINIEEVPEWFVKHYLQKVKKQKGK